MKIRTSILLALGVAAWADAGTSADFRLRIGHPERYERRHEEPRRVIVVDRNEDHHRHNQRCHHRLGYRWHRDEPREVVVVERRVVEPQPVLVVKEAVPAPAPQPVTPPEPPRPSRSMNSVD